MTYAVEPRPIVVVQNNHVARLTAPVAEAARRLGLTLRDVSSGAEAERHPPLPDGGPWGPVLIFGSVHFCRRWAAADPVLSPWIHWTEHGFDASTWTTELGDAMLNAGGHATTIAAFSSSDAGPMHLRPRGDMKFVGDAVRTEGTTGQRSIPGIVATPSQAGAMGIDPDTAIWASPVRTIDAEVRIWMIGGRAAGASTYRIDGAMHLSSSHPLIGDAVVAATSSHTRWHPAGHYVADLALSEGAWRIVEFNPVHSAGWYDADVDAILGSLVLAETARTSGCAR